MKIVVQSIEPLFNVEKQKPWWQYQKYSLQEIERISNYFTINHTFLSKDLEPDVKYNMKAIANKTGTYLPPYFTQEEYKSDESDYPVEKNQIGDQTNMLFDQSKAKQDDSGENNSSDYNKLGFFILNSLTLDFCLIKMLNISFFGAKIKRNDLQQYYYYFHRINNNKFDTDTLNELIKIISTHKIVKLFFDWNNLDQCANKDYFYESLFKSCSELELVTLRKQNIDDQMLAMICDSIIDQQNSVKIKFLDLFYNNITSQGLLHLEKLLQAYPKLSYIGLGYNKINQFAPIFNSIGKRLLSSEELAEYRKKEAERDAIVQKNTKNKGKNQEEVPVLDSVKEVGQDKFARFCNEQFQYLNLIQNPIGEQEKEQIESFLNNSFDGFTLSLSANPFEKKTIDRLKKKFGNKINFS